jgi:hypothetical protein
MGVLLVVVVPIRDNPLLAIQRIVSTQTYLQ